MYVAEDGLEPSATTSCVLELQLYTIMLALSGVGDPIYLAFVYVRQALYQMSYIPALHIVHYF